MHKWKIKLLEKIEEKGKGLFSGKADLEAMDFLSEKNSLTAVFSRLNEKNLAEKKNKEKKVSCSFCKRL